MQDQSPILSLPFILPSQAQKHVTHNEALGILDILVQLSVSDRTLSAPPPDPAEGERHIVANGAVGAWAGAQGQIATWVDGAWRFIAPQPGWRAEVLSEEEAVVFDGSAWVKRQPDLENLPGIGVGTTSDAVNRLAVASGATLFTHAGAGHQVKINKAMPGDTASVLFQTSFGGRAEMGLAGNDDWSIKVSADGSTWTEALRVDAATGRVSGQAVQSSPIDATAGRLLNVGAFGLGATTAPVLADLNAIDTPSGVYRTTTDTLNIDSVPSGADSFGYLRVERHTADSFTQYFTSVLTDSGLSTGTFYRKYRAASSPQWSPWRRVYDSNNLLGPVSQASGVPTGAVIERGANANGEYVRWADGTQICWHRLDMGSITTSGAGTLADPYRSAARHWTFPASFSGSFLPEITATAEYKGPLIDARRVVSVAKGQRNAITVFNLQLYRWADFSDADEYFLSLVAIGRWF